MAVRPLRTRLVPLIVFALAAAATAEPAATQPTTRPATYSLPEIDATVTLPDRWPRARAR